MNAYPDFDYLIPIVPPRTWRGVPLLRWVLGVPLVVADLELSWWFGYRVLAPWLLG